MTLPSLAVQGRQQQQENLDRVKENIGRYVLEFVRMRPKFHGGELEHYVKLIAPTTTPGSPLRILRLLRKQRLVNFRIVNRRQSAYEIIGFERLF